MTRLQAGDRNSFFMNYNEYLESAVGAAVKAGDLLRGEFGSSLDVNCSEQFDIKLELDVRTQELITGELLARHPGHAILGEEGTAGDAASAFEWIVDPIDGTVNYFYGIPHFCVSIALRHEGKIVAGVIHDPMMGETWQVAVGGSATLNGKPYTVSPRTRLDEAVVTVGFAKSEAAIQAGMPAFERLVHQVRKCRMMGSAALAMAYVACGRLDAFVESGISIWDVAAGIALVEAGGGKVLLRESQTQPGKFAITAWNGQIDLGIEGGTL